MGGFVNICCIMHADFEQPGYFQEWAQRKKYHFYFSKPYQGEILPLAGDFDFLLLMGGPQSPGEVDKFPYLEAEIALIKRAIHQKKPILGVCLGAQLIGEALGATTLKSPSKEVGFFPITLTPAGSAEPFLNHFSQELVVGHWHNDMPGLPAGAKVLAESKGCPRQIVKFSNQIFGFQCHMEFNRVLVQGLINNCPEDLLPREFVQSREVLLSTNCNEMNQMLGSFLDKFIASSEIIHVLQQP
jgi:GMP synthase (glutamine-hydrolysing)